MNDHIPLEAIQIAIEKRILNEFGSKILNEERMEPLEVGIVGVVPCPGASNQVQAGSDCGCATSEAFG